MQPNSGHLVLAAMERAGTVRQIITQNVDGLHQRAGSKQVIELHGSLRTVRCRGCKSVFDSRTMLPASEGWQSDYATGRYRYGDECKCSKCGGMLRPEVVMFGESLPEAAWKEAESISRNADFFVVLGSSLAVSPANYCPQLALDNGAQLLIVNQEPSALDAQATWVIRDSIGKVLLALAEQGLSATEADRRR